VGERFALDYYFRALREGWVGGITRAKFFVGGIFQKKSRFLGGFTKAKNK